MLWQLGFSDLSERLEQLEKQGDPLARLAEVVDFEMFRAQVERVWENPGEPQAQVCGGAQAEGPGDRLSFMAFLGLGLGEDVPDANTIWAFRERLKAKKVFDDVFARAVPKDDCRARRRQWSRAGRWLREVWLQARPLALRYQCFRARPLRAHRDPQRCRHGPPHRAAAAERHLSVGASFWDHDPPRQRGGADSRVGDRDDLRGLQHSGGGVGERPSATRAGLRRCRPPSSSDSRDRKGGRARTSCRTRCSCTSPIVATRPSVLGFRQNLDSTITA